MSRSKRKGGMVWEQMLRRRGAQSTVGRTDGRNRTQVRGGVREGLRGSVIQGPRRLNRQASGKRIPRTRAAEMSRARTQGPWS